MAFRAAAGSEMMERTPLSTWLWKGRSIQPGPWKVFRGIRSQPQTMTRRAKPPPPPGSERREHPRYEVLAQVEIRGGERTLVMPVRNISVGGMYVDLESHDPDGLGPALAAGQRATVFIDASDGGNDGLAVSREAEILRIDRAEPAEPAEPAARAGTRGRAGMALRWTLVSVEVAERFAHILEVLRQRGGPGDG
jgi:hypothetical protein